MISTMLSSPFCLLLAPFVRGMDDDLEPGDLFPDIPPPILGKNKNYKKQVLSIFFIAFKFIFMQLLHFLMNLNFNFENIN